MSPRATTSSRRDTDPVRVYKDGRIAYWDGGAPGVGHRRYERHATRAAAEARAVQLRKGLATGRRRFGELTLDDTMQSLLDHLRRTGARTGTIRQYKSNYNMWIPDDIGSKAIRGLVRADWAAIFDPLAAGATPATIKNVTRTLNALFRFADDREYFGTHLPFNTTAERRASIARDARKSARQRLNIAVQDSSVIALDACPDLASIDEFAEAVEAQYPGYGRRLVLLAFGTGLRICEVLALQVQHIDLAQGLIHVDQQLDRYHHWPAVVPPKGDTKRKALIWTAMLPVAESLMTDATRPGQRDPGWLFPRHRSTTGWADQAGKLVAEAISDIDWPWTFHWLRHGYASWLLAPASVGGFGQAPVDVQKWLGHTKLSTTLDTYVQPVPTGLAAAQIATARLPGETG